MLREIYKYLTTPCAPHLKAMGYLKELIALEARFRRCRLAWEPHTIKTKSVILDAAAHAEQKNKVVVLGSGILCDIPIDELSETFKEVHLVDVCFLKTTRNFLRQYPNVTLQVADITGLAKPLYDWAQQHGSDDPMPAPTHPKDVRMDDTDLVISANVLSQLPLNPLQFLRKTRTGLGEQALTKLAHDIIEAHQAFIMTCPGTVCLISEVERQYLDGKHTIETEDPLCGHAINFGREEWFWNVAPKSELSDGYELRNLVKGAYFEPSAYL